MRRHPSANTSFTGFKGMPTLKQLMSVVCGEVVRTTLTITLAVTITNDSKRRTTIKRSDTAVCG